MKRATDIYHRWVAWSEEDQTYIGRCPDLFRGGVHGDEPLKVARELQQVIDEWETHFQGEPTTAATGAHETNHGIRLSGGAGSLDSLDCGEALALHRFGRDFDSTHNAIPPITRIHVSPGDG